MTEHARDDMPISKDELRDRQIGALLSHHFTTAEQMTELAGKVSELAGQMTKLRQDVPAMMAEGIRTAVGDPATWQAARKAMTAQAETAAGGWLLGMLKFAIDKLLWALVALIAIYWAGGLPALLALLKAKVGS